MSKLKSIIQLVRWPNLVLVFLAQYIFVRCLLQRFQPIFTKEVFYLVALACVGVAAAGNIINDFYDREIDMVNKPDKVIIGKSITSQQSKILYVSLNIVSIVLGIYADYIQHSHYAKIFVLGSIVLLWLYSKYLKKTYLVGNLVVAFLSSAPMLLFLVLEIEDYGVGAQYPIVVLYLFFSFWTSLIREILKDCEDVEGDRMGKAKTLPIVSGIAPAKSILNTLICLMIGVFVALTYLLYVFQSYWLLGAVIILMFLFVFLLLEIKNSQTAKDFHKASSFLKWIMLFGVLSMILVKYTLNIF